MAPASLRPLTAASVSLLSVCVFNLAEDVREQMPVHAHTHTHTYIHKHTHTHTHMHTYSHMTANHNAEDAREQMRLYEEQGESFGDLFALLPNLPLNKVLEFRV